MKKCLSCASERLQEVEYPEGVIWICDVCGLQWGQVNQDANEFVATWNDYYLDPLSFGDTANYAPYVEFFETITRLTSKKQLTLLDVGCGSGVFISECLRRGHDAQGVEANEQMREHMDKDVVDRCHFGLAQDMPDYGKKFDVITFWDSFEHIESAFEILDSLRGSLADGGIVYLRVNNNKDIYNYIAKLLLRVVPSFGRNVFKKCFTFPAHCWNFSEQSMENLLEQRGFSISEKVVGETPASRLTQSLLFKSLICCAYFVNRMIGGGKIGNYYVKKND